MDGRDPRSAAARLIAAQPWVVLATVGLDGSPAASYMPFAIADDAFGIVASRLAVHTGNLLAHRTASIILVGESADASQDAYARARCSIAVSAQPQPRGSPAGDAIWSALEARHGATACVLRTLGDFEAIALAPQSGRLVLGFAAAHDLDAPAIIAALRAASAQPRR
jgi:putative heme iron utilization protein